MYTGIYFLIEAIVYSMLLMTVYFRKKVFKSKENKVYSKENLQSKSLKAYVDKFKPEYAIRTSMKDYREQDWLINMPLWCVSGLSE